jgi:hypothetical protein
VTPDPGPLLLTHAQRRAIGVRLGRMASLLRRLGDEGVCPPAAEDLERAIAEVHALTGAIEPTPPPHRLRAMLAPMVVLAGEVGARTVGNYGALDSRAEAALDVASHRLQDHVLRLLREIEAAQARPPRD